jgi:hypothetical protein
MMHLGGTWASPHPMSESDIIILLSSIDKQKGVPMIGDTTPGLLRTQARASWALLQPFALATSSTRSATLKSQS